jgi:hypothetical protein
MPDLFDTSRIPDDSGHWDALAERVAAGAGRESSRTGFALFAHSPGGWVAASLLLVAALAFLLLPADETSVTWVQALAPADDVGRAITLEDGPPPIAELLLRSGGVR